MLAVSADRSGPEACPARVQTTFDSEVLDLLMERDSVVGAYAAAQDQLAALTSDNR